MARRPTSCDTFAVLPPGCEGCVVFGKNSDRPADEVQEVVYHPAADHLPSARVRCTYIEIGQAPHTYATVLSKPAWMWGAEMGANEHGVCIGNEAIWTRVAVSAYPALLGMDLLRLALERADTAVKAVEVITDLLETHGQGGNCSETLQDFTYHNSFLIADSKEVWVLETVEKLWAAECITSGIRNISNDLSIRTKIDRKSCRLEMYVNDRGMWHPSRGPLNFKKALGYSDDDDNDMRYASGKQSLINKSKHGNFRETDMFKILRDDTSGICMTSGSFITTASQVSVIRPKSSDQPSVHWFTATPDPRKSVFKPFVFAEDIQFPPEVISPTSARSAEERVHPLHRLHEKYVKPRLFADGKRKLIELEEQLLQKTSNLDMSSANTLFKAAVEEEMKLYNSNVE